MTNITGLWQRRSAVRQSLKADDSLAATQTIPCRPVVTNWKGGPEWM